MAKSAKSIIHGMYTACLSRGLLSDESKKVMQEYFKRTARLTGGKKRARKTSKNKL